MDILVNNAGITRDGLLLRMSDEQWERVVDINLRGAFYCSRAVARAMVRARYGRIINIASVVGIAGNPGQANYVASKAGLIGLTKALALELAPRGITVNAVAPGFIKTAMTDALGEDTRKLLLDKVPLGRLGTPQDVAEAVTFLASTSGCLHFGADPDRGWRNGDGLTGSQAWTSIREPGSRARRYCSWLLTNSERRKSLPRSWKSVLTNSHRKQSSSRISGRIRWTP